jgi:hypothetical protein
MYSRPTNLESRNSAGHRNCYPWSVSFVGYDRFPPHDGHRGRKVGRVQDSTAVLALVVSVIALVASALLATRQTILMRRANQLPLMIDLIQELRSPDFLVRERYVNVRLKEHDPASGYSNLDPVAADHMQHVKSLFNSIGALIAFQVVDERLAISIFGYRANRAWCSMEKFITAERRLRKGNYAPYFEHFVVLVRENPPEQITASVGLKKLR